VPVEARRYRFETVVLRLALTHSNELYEWRRNIIDGADDRRPITIAQLERRRPAPSSTPGGPGAPGHAAVRPAFDAVESGIAYDELDLRPQFNFLVDLGTGATDGTQAGFQEVGPIAVSVDVIEYRNGNEN
jgi:hypothetical protein